METIDRFWSMSSGDVLQALSAQEKGLSTDEAEKRAKDEQELALLQKKDKSDLKLLLGQFLSPVILILIFAAVLSFFLKDRTDAVIILFIILVSGLLGWWQERGAAHAVEQLLKMIQVTVRVRRDGKETDMPTNKIVHGDILVLGAGDYIPADSLLLSSEHLAVDEAALTGESYPVEKQTAVLDKDTALGERTNALWMGTHVLSGEAVAVAVRIGKETEFGKISGRLRQVNKETDFEHGIRLFGYMLMEITALIVFIIFAVNVGLKRPVLDSLLFSLALAVGLTPQLLPAIISINLSYGARRLAKQKVIVKRLASIENFGSMNMLCADKTGSLTEGVVTLYKSLNVEGEDSDKVLEYAYMNACFESGYVNPIDKSLRDNYHYDVQSFRKVYELTYDFTRKRLSIILEKDGKPLMITKGALQNVLDVCSCYEDKTGAVLPISGAKKEIAQIYEEYSKQGIRILGVAYSNPDKADEYDASAEKDMTFMGYLMLHDPIKKDAAAIIRKLDSIGIKLKVLTGDHHLVAEHLAQILKIEQPKIVLGSQIEKMSDSNLKHLAVKTDIFAEVEPYHKERIIRALQQGDNVVGFLGDGINDASALKAADVGISVNSAAGVAKEAADIVMLEKNLKVLVNGVQLGRTTFINTMKYIFMATSANFGNMLSMAGASVFLPFLPLLPKQILLTNLLTDIPEMNIARDSVDKESVLTPRRMRIAFIRKFMIVFGILSSVFDFLTFLVLMYVLHARTAEFRTGWFVESVISASLIVFVIRTRQPFWKSKPGKGLLISSIGVMIATLILPYTLLGRIVGFTPLPGIFTVYLAGIVVLYFGMAEGVKRVFFRMAKER